jgi:collagen type VII alpha
LSDIYERDGRQRTIILVLSFVVMALGLMLACPIKAAAQVTGPPHVFVANTVASPDEVNLNFSTIYDAALNRTGGTMTGTLTGVSATFSGTLGVTGATTLGSTLGVTGVATFTAAAAFNSTSAAAIDVAGGITAGSGNVGIIDTTGKIPAISSTFFASLSGANLTGIVETAITDGAILARVASAETISGLWAFSNTGTTTFAGAINLANTRALTINNASGTAVNIATIDGSSNLTFGTDLATVLDVTFATGGGGFTWKTNNISRTTLDNAGALAHAYALRLTGTISPAALGAGNNNNYNPTSLSSASYVILTADAGGSTLTGLTAQAAGTEITLCEPTTAAGSLTIAHESASSTAANRFNLGAGGNITLNKDTSGGVAGPCATFWYYGAGARWLLKSASTSVP